MLRLEAPFQGGEQERRLRPGTLNTLAIVGTAAAMDLHERRRGELLEHLRACDDAFINVMKTKVPGFNLTIPQSQKCPGIVNFYIHNVDAQSLVHDVSEKVCANRGASCSGAGGEKVRHVPAALGLPVEIAANVIRVSFGFVSSVEDAKIAAEIFAAAAT
jgi:cysteine desulfurase